MGKYTNSTVINESRKSDYKVEIDPIEEVLVTKPVFHEDLGIYLNETKVEKFDTRKRYEGIKPADFSLQAVLSAGALGTLKSITLDGNRLGVVDNAEIQLSNINISE